MGYMWICQSNTTGLTTFCRPSMRLLTTTLRPLSSWKRLASSSQERSHINSEELVAGTSVFWPITLVAIEDGTSSTSVLSLNTFASSEERENKLDVDFYN